MMKSHNPPLSSWLWITNYLCLLSAFRSLSSSLRDQPTDSLLQCLCSSNVYFDLIMALKCKVMQTKKRCKVFSFKEKYSKKDWERGRIHVTSNTVCSSNDFITVMFSLCLTNKLNFTVCIQYGLQFRHP